MTASKRVNKLCAHVVAHRIAVFGPVQGDGGNASVDREFDELIGHVQAFDCGLALCADLQRGRRCTPAAPADADSGIAARLRRGSNDVSISKPAAVLSKSTNRSAPEVTQQEC